MLTIEQHSIPAGLQEFYTTVRREFSFIHLITKGGCLACSSVTAQELFVQEARPAWTSFQTNCPWISHLSFSTLPWLPTALCFAAWGFPKCLDDFEFCFTIGSFIPQKANSLASVGDHGNTFQSSFCWWDPCQKHFTTLSYVVCLFLFLCCLFAQNSNCSLEK